jgi:alginate O-acetyltransferase complex protein AlgI
MLAQRSHTLQKFTSGAAIFMLGFAKKILLANSAGQVADAVFRSNNPDFFSAWWGILGYHFQIYLDFCGYSDMAVGLARMLGIEFIKNFNAPYFSTSVTDFWRRWHISLSTFIRDYLYIPMGGNRKGAGRTYFNLVTVFFLCGLWHGAKMTFVVWGIFQGVFMVFERLRGKKSLYGNVPWVVQILITNIIIMFAWAVFRAPSLAQGIHYWGAMLGVAPVSITSSMLHAEIFSSKHIVEMLICAFCIWQPLQAHEWVLKLTPFKLSLCLIAFVYAIFTMVTQTYNPFLYFQF